MYSIINKLLTVFFLCISIQAESQIENSKDKLFAPSVLIRVNSNPELAKKYKIRRIIRYSAKHKLKDYKKHKFYIIYQYNESDHSVRSKSYSNGKLYSEGHYYYDKDNNLIRDIFTNYDSTVYSYTYNYGTSKKHDKKFKYENGLLVEKVGYGDGKLVERYIYKYNNQNLLSETYRFNSKNKVLIQKNSYNNDQLIDTIYSHAYVGKKSSYKTYEYDSLKNIVKEVEVHNYKKDKRMLSMNYIYDTQNRVTEKLIKNNEYPNSLFHWKYEYKKNGKKEIYTEYLNDTVYSVQENSYDKKNNLILSINTSGKSKGRYTKYKYDKNKELLLYIERGMLEERDYMIYE